MDWSRKPTLMEWLATDAYYDGLYRGVYEAYEDGKQSMLEKRALEAEAIAAVQQPHEPTG